MHQGQFDAADREMAMIMAKARGDDANFVICEVHGLDLVYRKTQTGALQLVLPKSHGLHLHVMLEMHILLYSVHLGMRKTIAVLQQHFWWPKLPKHVAAFVKGCAICQRIKGVNTLPAGLL